MSICKDCALRLFNDRYYNIDGVGNPLSGIMIVVPNVDYDAYKAKDMTFSKYVEIINDILSFTGGIENYYVVPLIRCKLNEQCPVDKHIARRCMIHTFHDIKMYGIKKVMLLGDAAKYMNFSVNGNADEIHIVGNVGYSTDYSPFIKFIDDNKYDEFRSRLIKWIDANKHNGYNGMKVIRYDT